MEFEEMQNLWQKQNAADQMTIGSDALLKMVRRDHQAIAKNYFVHGRILAFVFAAIYIPLWIWLGITKDLPWSWYLEIPAFLWVAFFVLKNLRLHRGKQLRPGDSIKDSVEHSLGLVDQQIHLQKKIVWWYLLPPWLPMAIYFVHTGILKNDYWGAGFNLIVSSLVFWGVYELNQMGVRKNLEPRRSELRDFLTSLEISNSEETIEPQK